MIPTWKILIRPSGVPMKPASASVLSWRSNSGLNAGPSMEVYQCLSLNMLEGDHSAKRWDSSGGKSFC
jgi:hypothetical protein